MSPSYKPDDHTSVSPYLVVEDADRLLTFLESVFDAEIQDRHELRDGTVQYAEVRIDDSIQMVGQADVGLPEREALVHVFVPDVDECYECALEADAVSMNDPKQVEGDPDRRAIVLGPEGNTWAISTRTTGL